MKTLRTLFVNYSEAGVIGLESTGNFDRVKSFLGVVYRPNVPSQTRDALFIIEVFLKHTWSAS